MKLGGRRTTHAAAGAQDLPSQDRPDLKPQRFRYARLGEIGVASGLEGVLAAFADGGDDHDRNVFGPARFANVLEHSPTVYLRHGEVEHDNIRTQIVRLVDAAASVNGGERDTSIDPEVLGVHTSGVHVIVDD